MKFRRSNRITPAEVQLAIQESVVRGVAHDFGHVIAVNKGYLTLLERDLNPLAEEEERREAYLKAKRDIQAMRESIRQGEHLITQLSDICRVGFSEPILLNPNDIVYRACNVLIYPGVDIVYDLDPRVREMPLVISEIESILFNLCGNARDAMPEGGTLRVKTLRQKNDLVLEVTDTGTGMDIKVVTRIFEPFYTTKVKGKGTGLGLAYVAAIVRRAGGDITVTSTPGTGTTFTVRLPRARPANP
jgi:signal transduction histidine kinase